VLGVHGGGDPRNAASARVMEKLRMRPEALVIENARIKGEWCDSPISALLRREWASLR
jgi:RimJ/RimL family protein N-acetyltransferase